MADEDPADGDEGVDHDRDPLGDLADRIRARSEPDAESTEPDEPSADRFVDMGEQVREPATETEGVFGDLEDPSEEFDEFVAEEELDRFGETISAGEVEDEFVVDKRAFCERCEYLSDPPTFECEHDGTEIVEFVSMEEVRVRNCPVVAERQLLGEFDVDE